MFQASFGGNVNKRRDLPSFAKSRRGNVVSVLDAIVQAMWPASPPVERPSLTFGEITQRASTIVGYEVKAPAIRGYAYRRPDLFDRLEVDSQIRWRLSDSVRAGGGLERSGDA
jgi:hypothetical protein